MSHELQKKRKAEISDKLHSLVLIEALMLLYPLHIFLGNKLVCFYDLSHTAFSFIKKPCNIVPLHSEPKHIWHHNSARANKIPTAIDSALAKCLMLIWQKDSWYINEEITKTISLISNVHFISAMISSNSFKSVSTLNHGVFCTSAQGFLLGIVCSYPQKHCLIQI